MTGNGDFTVQTYGEDRKLILWTIDFFTKGLLVQHDSPDMYGVKDNEVLVLEHFEFDCTKQSKSGSDFRAKNASVERKFDAFMPENPDGELFQDKIECVHSTDYYMANSLSGFRTHYQKVGLYKENLSRIGVINELTSKVVSGFFIEDVTLLGSTYIDKLDKSWRPIILLHCKHFLDAFQEASDLDFVIFGFYNQDRYKLWFISRESIKDYRENEIDLVDISILNMTPQFLGYKSIIKHKQDK